jgi:AAA ATPase-like protein
MNNCPPPYRPLRGAEPPHFVDRAEGEDIGANGIVAGSMAAFAAGPCDPRFHRLVTSGPAMGKTAVLRAIGQEAARRLGWAVSFHSCQAKERALGALAAEIESAMLTQWPAHAGRLATEVLAFGCRPTPTVPVGALDHPSNPVPLPRLLGLDGEHSWATLKQFCKWAGLFARSLSRGVLVIFDDLERLGAGEAESLGHLARALTRDGLPVALLLGGGQQLAERFARAGNFTGCVWPTGLQRFDDGEAREALIVPAAERGVDFDEEALELLCAAADGSPLDVQRLGFAAWSAASGSELITLGDAHEALGLVGPLVTERAS